jgi:hypothetical protein
VNDEDDQWVLRRNLDAKLASGYTAKTAGDWMADSTNLLGEPDEEPFWPANIAKPVGVFILDDFAHELGAAQPEPHEHVVEVVHGEHDAEVTASGSALDRVLRLTCYVADTKHVERVTAVCALALTGHKPAGSVVAARTLQPGCAIAVDAIAAVSEEP